MLKRLLPSCIKQKSNNLLSLPCVDSIYSRFNFLRVMYSVTNANTIASTTLRITLLKMLYENTLEKELLFTKVLSNANLYVGICIIEDIICITKLITA